MPTGYTADVGDGKVSDFRTFALLCARAFGATIMQRDDPMNEPPKPRLVSEYDVKRVHETRDDVARYAAMTLEEAETAAAAEYASRLAEEKEYATKRIEKRSRYETMLAEVDGWTPPTAEHEGMKKFMQEQLASSIDFDCTEYPSKQIRYRAEVWLAKKRESAAENLVRAEKSLAEEIERCEKANAWISALYESLAPTTTGHPVF